MTQYEDSGAPEGRSIPASAGGGCHVLAAEDDRSAVAARGRVRVLGARITMLEAELTKYSAYARAAQEYNKKVVSFNARVYAESNSPAGMPAEVFPMCSQLTPTMVDVVSDSEVAWEVVDDDLGVMSAECVAADTDDAGIAGQDAATTHFRLHETVATPPVQRYAVESYGDIDPKKLFVDDMPVGAPHSPQLGPEVRSRVCGADRDIHDKSTRPLLFDLFEDDEDAVVRAPVESKSVCTQTPARARLRPRRCHGRATQTESSEHAVPATTIAALEVTLTTPPASTIASAPAIVAVQVEGQETGVLDGGVGSPTDEHMRAGSCAGDATEAEGRQARTLDQSSGLACGSPPESQDNGVEEPQVQALDSARQVPRVEIRHFVKEHVHRGIYPHIQVNNVVRDVPPELTQEKIVKLPMPLIDEFFEVAPTTLYQAGSVEMPQVPAIDAVRLVPREVTVEAPQPVPAVAGGCDVFVACNVEAELEEQFDALIVLSTLAEPSAAQRKVVLQCARVIFEVRTAEGVGDPIQVAVREAAALVLEGIWGPELRALGCCHELEDACEGSTLSSSAG